MRFFSPSSTSGRGFTLLEMLCVIGIASLLLTLGAPAIISLNQQAGRKSAVNQLLNFFEQARAVALTQGTATYVAFANDQMPAGMRGYCHRAVVLLREATDEEKAQPNAPAFVPLTRWHQLPSGVAFGADSPLLQDANRILFDNLPSGEAFTLNLPAIKFAPTGAVIWPGARQAIFYLYDQTNGPAQNPARLSAAIYDTFRFARFTGRAQWATETSAELLAQSEPVY